MLIAWLLTQRAFQIYLCRFSFVFVCYSFLNCANVKISKICRRRPR
uniref:Uncharacterized protein n=1 Tax=Arundo donax TaxID=35708 RepID=A0A0A9FR51_ARUDO